MTPIARIEIAQVAAAIRERDIGGALVLDALEAEALIASAMSSNVIAAKNEYAMLVKAAVTAADRLDLLLQASLADSDHPDATRWVLKQLRSAIAATTWPLPESGRRPDITPLSHPDHHTVGREFMGGIEAKRWFCESHDAEGYWMYPTDGSGDWHNVSERAIGRSFHEIHIEPGGRLWCSWGKVKPYIPADVSS
jgi:hypothetical protein